MSYAHGITRYAILAVAVFGFTLPTYANNPSEPTSDRSKAKAPVVSIDLFEGMKSGVLEVVFIPSDSSRATVIVKNKTEKPQSVRMPAAFAGVPIHAQFGGMGGGMGGMGGGMGGMGGGGMGGGMGGMGGGGGFGGGLLNLSPEKVRRLKVTTVCLEHGKKEPNSRMKYTIIPIERFTKKTEVIQLCALLGTGRINRDAAQAAAWHFTDNMSWGQLANKVGVVHLNGFREAFFSPQEVMVGMRIAGFCRERAAMVKEYEKRMKQEKSLADGKSLSQQ